jgi:hypothetical protein
MKENFSFLLFHVVTVNLQIKIYDSVEVHETENSHHSEYEMSK